MTAAAAAKTATITAIAQRGGRFNHTNQPANAGKTEQAEVARIEVGVRDVGHGESEGFGQPDRYRCGDGERRHDPESASLGAPLVGIRQRGLGFVP